MSAAKDPQPRLARVAAAIGDPSRARMLSRLLDGRHYTAKELAECAGVTAPTASQHLRLLVDERLARSRSQGRHRYFTLADGNVGHALEALLRVADGPLPETIRWQAPKMRGLRHARSCYGHLAGELGVKLCENFVKNGWVSQAATADQDYQLTTSGLKRLQALNLTVGRETVRNARAQLYGCVDWSERKDHFAGPLAVTLLDAFINRGWLQRSEHSRALTLTTKSEELSTLLGLNDFQAEQKQ
jgi:DNA-binding transcriptional ArsR family regulator